MGLIRWSGAVSATLAVLAVLVLSATVKAPTVEAAYDSSRAACGSALTVVQRGTGYAGGEMRADEDSFDAACVRRAETRVRVAVVMGGTAAVLAGGTFILLRRRPKKARPRTMSNSASAI
ncbi:hypothetical protein E8D34_02070 [Nocardioides sp. GY 10113]|uniref:hypothetical protein n=1 Tax=Nocardioides sp. GY 10113 TaxID=2569761 RepID=UPI0010A89626|nr:hypothetical protein [Nocardioides sp. GY 10113]TIC89296.1 hypothetical protein E8D34_02070 [Nocardioides sp. GY 10113]